MDRSRVGIVVPALNEEATIAQVVRQCAGFGIPIVVDDGSSDATGEVSKSEGADVVRHAGNKGYDEALNSGFRRAEELGCEFVITIDADGQHAPELIGRMLELLDTDADLVVGIRERRQRFGEHCFAYLSRALYGIADPLCGMKGYRMSLYKQLGHFDSYGSIGTELALFAARNGSRVAQLPMPVRDREGQPRFGRRFIANHKILRAMFLSLIRG